MQDNENQKSTSIARRILHYPYQVYRAILLALFRPLVKENEKLLEKAAVAQDEQLKKATVERERFQTLWQASFSEMSTAFHLEQQELGASLSQLQSALSAMRSQSGQEQQELTEVLSQLQSALSAMRSQSGQEQQELGESLSQLQNMLSTVQSQILKEVGWNRDAVYEVRDENRIHATTLQKLQEQDIALNEGYRNEIHRHIDFTYRDLMTLLRGKDGVWSKEVSLETDYPIAYESNDTISPHGTIRDNTRYPRFVFRCEQIFAQKEHLNFLDLGCSGGGMVLEALLRGHYALGLEGCDESLRQQRAEWRLIPEHLKTCDISKPFSVKEKNTNTPVLFDVVTAWEVLEHIAETDLPQLIKNIYHAMEMGGIFVATVAAKTDIDPVTGRDWHQTIKPFVWWKALFEANGFTLENDQFTIYDLARGVYNPPHCYEQPYDVSKANFEEDFYLVARKTGENPAKEDGE